MKQMKFLAAVLVFLTIAGCAKEPLLEASFDVGQRKVTTVVDIRTASGEPLSESDVNVVRAAVADSLRSSVDMFFSSFPEGVRGENAKAVAGSTCEKIIERLKKDLKACEVREIRWSFKA